MSKEHLNSYAEKLRSVTNEDQLKRPVAELIEAIGKGHGYEIDARTETHVSEHKVRPDIAVHVNGLLCGYIELKAHGKGADPNKFSDPHDKKQWEKLQKLPNLIYTDGEQWGLYRTGEPATPWFGITGLSDNLIDIGKEAITDEVVKKIGEILRAFFAWEPSVPSQPQDLAKDIAPLAKLLRLEVENIITNTEESALILLENEWRNYLFPNTNDAEFADSYAQTMTYAMLLARLSGAKSLDTDEAVDALKDNNGALATALEIMTHPRAKKELKLSFDVLRRTLEKLDPHSFMKNKPELWLYFYENFLAAYDSELRKSYGVYYTPPEVVELQVRLADQLLEKHFGKSLGFADEGVVFLDPAVGTGTYLVSAVRHGLEKAKEVLDKGGVPGQVRQIAKNMHGFEILVGPYAVAHWRLRQTLESYITDGKNLGQKLKVYLADTLASPFEEPDADPSLTHEALANENKDARDLKKGGDILVCLGNPPYDRQVIDLDDETTKRKGGWVRDGNGKTPILDAFIEPVIKAGKGVHLKSLYNDYVYFWCWALWRLFEQQHDGGIITFITASSYLRGEAFLGMREVMRRNFDELWIIDLEGGSLGNRTTPNVFQIRTSVAIAIGVRGKTPSPDTPAKVRYVKIEGETRKAKLDTLAKINTFEDKEWQECPDDWHAPFMPAGEGDFFAWPAIDDIFPWLHSGSEFKRTWPIGETKEVIKARYKALVTTESEDQKRKLFKETRDRKIDWSSKNMNIPSVAQIDKLPKDLNIKHYSYRVFDRRYAIIDPRFADYLRTPLLETCGGKQIFLVTLNSFVLGEGAAMVACPYLPDLHHLSGGGGKDMIPLYRDRLGNEPNITHGLLDFLGETYGKKPSPEDLAAYTYAVLAGQSYTKRFWNELQIPGVHLPLTRDSKIFRDAVKLGKKLIELHTYGECFRGDKQRQSMPTGKAGIRKEVSPESAKYPETFRYRHISREIIVGDGIFRNVAPEVWQFKVSGLQVVESWLAYRMKKRKGKKSSPLDEIRPKSWDAEMSNELLRVLRIIEKTLDLEEELEKTLDEITDSDLFLADELPKPTDAQRKPPDARDPDDPQDDLLESLTNSPESEKK